MRFNWLPLLALLTATCAQAQTQPPFAWSHFYPDSGYGNIYDFCESLYQDGIYAVGSVYNTDSCAIENGCACSTGMPALGPYPAKLYKLDNNGNIIKTQCYGGIKASSAQRIAAAHDGNLVIGAITAAYDGDVNTFPVDTTYGDPWIFKIDTAGNILWRTLLHGAGQERIQDLYEAPNGHVFIAIAKNYAAGIFDTAYGSSFSTDTWVFELDNAGAVVWKRCFGGSADDYIKAVEWLPNNEVQLYGYSSSDDGDLDWFPTNGYVQAWIVRLDSARQIKWQKLFYTLTGGSTATAYLRFNSNKVLVQGNVNDTNNVHFNVNHPNDALLFYIDSLGNVTASNSFGGSSGEGNPYFTHPRLSRYGEYLVTGFYTQSSDGDVANSIGGPSAAWITVIDTNLNYIKGYRPAGGLQMKTCLAVGSQIVASCGTLTQPSGMPTVSPEPVVCWLFAIDLNTSIPTFAEEKISVNVYPNPNNGEFNLEVTGELPPGSLRFELYDAQGRQVISKKVSERRTRFAIERLPAGSYTYRLSGQRCAASGAIIIQ